MSAPDGPGPGAPKRGARWPRRVALALGAMLALAAVALVALGFWARTEAGNRAILAAVLVAAAPARGTLTAARLQTDLLTHLHLDDITLADADGNALVHVGELDLAYDLGGIAGRRIVIGSALADGVLVDLQAPDGRCLNPAGLWDAGPPSDAPWTGLGIDIQVDQLAILADSVTICTGGDPVVGTNVTVNAAASLVGPRLRVPAIQVDGVLRAGFLPEPSALDVVATGDWDGRAAHVDSLAAHLGSARLAASGLLSGLDTPDAIVALNLGRLYVEPQTFAVPGVHGWVSASGTVKGRLDRPALDLTVQTPGGQADVAGTIDVSGTIPAWHATVDLAQPLQLAETVDALKDTTLSGSLVVDGIGVTGADLVATATVDLTAPVLEGAGPYTVRGPLTVQGSTIASTGLDLGSPAGTARVALEAHIDEQRVTGAVIDTDIDLAGLAAYGAPGLRGHLHYTGGLSGGWGGTLRAHAAGRVHGGPIGAREQVTVGHVQGPVGLEWAGTDGTLEATLEASDLHVPAARIDAASATVRAAVDFGSKGLAGRIDARAVDVAMPGDHVDVLVANTLLTATGIEFAALGGNLAADAAPDALPDDETLSAQGVYAFAGSLALAEARYAPRRDVDWHLTEPAQLTLREDGVDVQLRAAGVPTPGQAAPTAEVRGTFRSRGACDLTLAATGFPLTALRGWFPDQAWGGTVGVDAHLAGPVRAPVGTFALTGVDLALPGALRTGDVDLHGTVDGTRLTASGALRHERDAPLVRATVGLGLRTDGELPALDPAAPLAVTVTLPPHTGDEWQAVLAEGLLPADLPGVRLAGELALGGTLQAPTARLAAGTWVHLREGWIAVDTDVDVADDVANVRVMADQQLVRRAQVTGSLKLGLSRVLATATGAPFPELGGLASALELDVVPLQLPLSSLGAPATVKGSLLGGLHVSGEPTRPKVEGALLVINGSVGGVALSSAMLTLTGRDDGYDVDAQVGFEGGGGVHAAGYVPVEANLGAIELDRSGLLLTVDGDGVPLGAASAFVPGLSGATGLARVSGTVTGQPNAPNPDLALTLRGGAFNIDPLNVRYTNVDLDVHVLADGVDLGRLSATTTPLSRDSALVRTGTLSASGHMALAAYQPGELHGSLDLGSAWVADRPDLALQATAALRLTGTWPVLSVGGRVDVDSADLTLRESFFTAESSLQLDPDIAVLRAGVVAAQAVEAEPPVDLNLDVQVFLNRHADVDVTIPMEQFGGELTKSLSNLRFDVSLDSPEGLHLQRKHGVVQLAGVVEPLSGVANVLGKDFDIGDGTVSFTGVDYLSPLLNLDAVYDSGTNGAITAHISGTATAPGLSFTSDQGKSTDDMISILLFGAPIADLQDSSGSSAAIAAAFQSVFKSQMNDAASLTRLDVVEFSSDSATFGKRFGKDVMVKVVLNPQSEANSTTIHKNPVELHVELPLWKGWYLEGMGGTAGIGELSAYSRWRF